jgi:hypothetical protein
MVMGSKMKELIGENFGHQRLKSFWLPKGKLRHFFQTEFFGPLQRSL